MWYELLTFVAIVLIVGWIFMSRSPFMEQTGGNSLSMTAIPSRPFPVDRPYLRDYWGPYLWGWNPRPFYEYGPTTSVPYPYSFECDRYANQQCKDQCDSLNSKWGPFCYKHHYMRCSAGVALTDPETNVGQC